MVSGFSLDTPSSKKLMLVFDDFAGNAFDRALPLFDRIDDKFARTKLFPEGNRSPVC